MKKHEFHPAANIFPLNDTGPEFQAFVEDIKRNGLRHPIVLHEGKILDGRRRYLACQKARVEPEFLAWDGRGSPVDFVISLNIHRRHLTPSQRAVLALDLLAEEEGKAKERQKLSRGRGKKGSHPCPTLTGKATEQVAKRVGCSARMVQMAKKVREVQPELIDEVLSTKLTVSEAHKHLMRQPHDDRMRDRENYPTPPEMTEALLRREQLGKRVWEPACGVGAMAEVIKANGYDVIASDKYDDYGYGYQNNFVDPLPRNKLLVRDTTGCKSRRSIANIDSIVTNPPFSLAPQFILRALEIVPYKVAMLLPITFLEGEERYQLLFRHCPPNAIHFFVGRYSMYPQGEENRGNGRIAFAWFVWTKGSRSRRYDWI